MTIAFKVRDGWAERIPAVVHVDGTVRPQVLREAVNPYAYAVLSEFYKLTGCPALIQTSNNLHESPVVRTIEDARDVLEKGGIDVLVSPEGIEHRV